jgi:hypothetical protein
MKASFQSFIGVFVLGCASFGPSEVAVSSAPQMASVSSMPSAASSSSFGSRAPGPGDGDTFKLDDVDLRVSTATAPSEASPSGSARRQIAIVLADDFQSARR